MSRQHWSVTVSMNGEGLVTIESNCLSGKPEFTYEEAQIIRDAARHLKAFIGEPAEPGGAEPPQDATAELLAALDELYPLPDDTRRVERAGRTAHALKRWMGKAHAELEALVAGVIDRAASGAGAAPPLPRDAREYRRRTGVEVDNHHNALMCPYCNPDGLKFAEPAGAAPPPVQCSVLSGFGSVEWFGCVLDKGHKGEHRNKSGWQWPAVPQGEPQE